MLIAEAEAVISNFWQVVATTGLGIIISFVIFWATVVRTMVTKEEVCELIQNRSLYGQDRQYIMEKLAANKEMQNQLSVALQKHSEVMSELRIQIATLAKTLETLEDRMER